MDTQLLCTFTTTGDVDATVSGIYDFYNIIYNYIYILQNIDDSNELFVTYNIESGVNIKSHLPNTILVHRKKDTNTIYTINALNNLIIYENNGILDSSYIVNWGNHRNSIILTGNRYEGYRKINTKIYEILNVK
jgi:hypothetical protein